MVLQVGPLLVGNNHLITQAGGLVTADGAAVNLHNGHAADGLPTMMNRQIKVDYLSTGGFSAILHLAMVA